MELQGVSHHVASSLHATVDQRWLLPILPPLTLPRPLPQPETTLVLVRVCEIILSCFLALQRFSASSKPSIKWYFMTFHSPSSSFTFISNPPQSTITLPPQFFTTMLRHNSLPPQIFFQLFLSRFVHFVSSMLIFMTDNILFSYISMFSSLVWLFVMFL